MYFVFLRPLHCRLILISEFTKEKDRANEAENIHYSNFLITDVKTKHPLQPGAKMNKKTEYIWFGIYVC